MAGTLAADHKLSIVTGVALTLGKQHARSAHRSSDPNKRRH